MKSLLKSTIVLLIIASIVCTVAATAWAAQVTSEVRVYAVADWTLYGRTASGEPLSFNPYYAQSGTTYAPAGPAKLFFPAVESGETARITWTMDAEGRRRVDAITITSALTGVARGVVYSSASTQLVIRPKDEPGTVTMNPKYVQVEGRWVPEPAVASKLATLAKGTKVTVNWSWEGGEGRKRITGITIGW